MQPTFLKQLKPSTNGKYVICFPFAGGYSTAFRPVAQHFAADWGLLAVEPPGHGSNRSPLMSSLEQLVDYYMEHLEPKLNMPFALYGHSMGGLIAHQIAARLEARGLRPEALIISGSNPPHIRRVKTKHLNEDDFVQYVVSLGGIPPELLEHKELLELFLPVLRADFNAVEGYEPPDLPKVQTPTYVMAGLQDERCTPESAQEWSQWVERAEFYEFEDGHMFILSESEKVAKLIERILNTRVLI